MDTAIIDIESKFPIITNSITKEECNIIMTKFYNYEIIIQADKIKIKGKKDFNPIKNEISNIISITKPIFSFILNLINSKEKYKPLKVIDYNIIYMIIQNTITKNYFIFKVSDKKIKINTSNNNEFFENELLFFWNNKNYEVIWDNISYHNYLFNLFNDINKNLLKFVAQTLVSSKNNLIFYITSTLNNNYNITYKLINLDFSTSKFPNYKIRNQNFNIKLSQRDNSIFIYEENENVTFNLLVIFNIIKDKFDGKIYCFKKIIKFKYNSYKEIKEFFELFLSYWICYINLRYIYLLLRYKTYNDERERRDKFPDPIFDIKHNLKNEVIGFELNSTYYVYNIELEAKSNWFIPNISYSEYYLNKFDKIINFQMKYHQNNFFNISFFNIMLCEFSNYPQFEFIIKNIINYIQEFLIERQKVSTLISFDYKFLYKHIFYLKSKEIKIKIWLLDVNLNSKSYLLFENKKYIFKIKNKSRVFDKLKDFVRYILNNQLKEIIHKLK